MKLTLRSRIYLAILPLLYLYLGVTYFLVSNIDRLSDDTKDISSTNLDISRSLTDVQSLLAATGAILDGGINYRATGRSAQTIERLSQRIGANAERIEDAAINPELAEAMIDLDRYTEGLFRIQGATAELAAGEGDAEALYPLIMEAEDWTRRLNSLIDSYLTETQEQIEAHTQNAFLITVGGMLVAIMLTLAISSVVWLRIIRPIEQITEGMEQFSSDSEGLDIKYWEDDELGYLSRSLEGMTARLKEYQDLTNKKLIRSTSALRSILDHSPDAFFILPESLVPIYTSPSAKKLVQDSDLENGFPPDVETMFRDSLAGSDPSYSKELRDAVRIPVAGEEKWFLVHTFPIDIPDAEDFNYEHALDLHNVAVILQDVTLLKLSDSLRKNLIATVSHELKTLITSARMSLYLLLEQQLGPLNESQLELVETARDDVNRQLATIEHLLDLSRVEEHVGELKLSDFSIDSLIQESLNAHAELARSYQQALNYKEPEQAILVRADKDKIRIVLNNFIVNAIKYSGEGKQIEIHLSTSKDHCRVEVKDNGDGMNEKTVRAVFDGALEAQASKTIKSAGLGLKIAKDIMDTHSGQIGCKSKEGTGSTFFFDILLA